MAGGFQARGAPARGRLVTLLSLLATLALQAALGTLGTPAPLERSLAGPAPAAVPRPPADRTQGDVPIVLRVPRMDDARAQLAHARRLKARSFRAKGDEDRVFWRGLAVEAYRAVRELHPSERALGAEAAFRAGELLRADQDVRGARTELQAADELGAGTPFRARARLELGHLQRREGELRRALDRYLAVASDARVTPKYREEAWLWSGRCWWDRGAKVEARAAWEGVAERAFDPFLTLRAYENLALAWIEDDDLEAAAGELERSRAALAPILLEESERGEKLQDAYRRSRAREALREAIERRRTQRSERKSVQATERFVRETLDTETRMLHR